MAHISADYGGLRAYSAGNPGPNSYMRARAYGGLPDRYPSTQANPVASRQKITRPVSLIPTAPPRLLNPKLNATPWSTSYAVKRPVMSKSKTKKVRHG